LHELKKGTAILVTGTPGTGKTTLSHVLAEALHAKYVNPVVLLTRKGIDHTYDNDRRTRVISPTRLENSLRSLARRTECGLVIDSHMSFQVAPPPELRIVIVLRCHPATLEQRLKRKRWSKHKIRENVLAEIVDVCLWDAVHEYGWKRIVEIDTTKNTPERAGQLAIRAFEKKRVRRSPKVSWLSTLKHESSLAQYFV